MYTDSKQKDLEKLLAIAATLPINQVRALVAAAIELDRINTADSQAEEEAADSVRP